LPTETVIVAHPVLFEVVLQKKTRAVDKILTADIKKAHKNIHI
jgi:hypothetical protein